MPNQDPMGKSIDSVLPPYTFPSSGPDVPPVFVQGAALQDPENIRKLTDGKTIPVYIRKGSDNRERWLSFTIPDEMSQIDLLAMGIAIDGNQALWSIRRLTKSHGQMLQEQMKIFDGTELQPTEFAGAFTRGHASLPDALLTEERKLLDWFKERGYAVKFS